MLRTISPVQSQVVTGIETSRSGEMQLEGHAVQASAPGVKRPAEAVLLDMHSIVTNEQCDQRIQSVLTELGFTSRNYLVWDSSWYGLNQGSVLDVTTMNLSDDLVQSKCEMMWNGQEPTLLIERVQGS